MFNISRLVGACKGRKRAGSRCGPYERWRSKKKCVSTCVRLLNACGRGSSSPTVIFYIWNKHPFPGYPYSHTIPSWHPFENACPSNLPTQTMGISAYWTRSVRSGTSNDYQVRPYEAEPRARRCHRVSAEGKRKVYPAVPLHVASHYKSLHFPVRTTPIYWTLQLLTDLMSL